MSVFESSGQQITGTSKRVKLENAWYGYKSMVLIVMHSFTAVLPYLELTNYSTFAGVLDRAVRVTIPSPLPFGKLRETIAYVRFCAG